MEYDFLQLVITSPIINAFGWPESSPHRDLNPGQQIERHTTYQLSYPFPHENVDIFGWPLKLMDNHYNTHLFITVTAHYL